MNKYYWFVIADNIKVISNIVGWTGFFGFLLFGMAITFGDFNDKTTQRIKKSFTYCLLMFLFGLITTFVPDTKQLATIYVLPRIIENKKLNEIPDRLLNLTDEWIKELSPKKETK